MADTTHSRFVRDVADEFLRRYPEPTMVDDRDDEFWLRCPDASPSRFRSPLTFGIIERSITVAFDGITVPVLIRPPFKDAAKARCEAFALFDDLITDRKVAMSFWAGDECVAAELVPHEEIQARRIAWRDHAARVRSWSGYYDYNARG